MNKISCKDSALAFLCGFLLCQILVGFVSVFASFICNIINIEVTALQTFFNNPFGYLILAVAMDLGLFLVFIFFKRNREVKIVNKPTAKKLIFYIALALCAFICLYPIVTCVDYLFSKLNIPASPLPYKLNTQGYLVSILSLAVLPAIFEELLFRGIILSGLKHIGKTFSIVVSAVMFAVFHMSINQTIYPILMGLLLGGIMFKENNILYTIVVHFVSNFITLTLTYFNITLAFSHWTYILLAVVLFALFLTFVLFYAIQNNKATKQEKITKQELVYLISCSSIMLLLWIIINVTNIL